VKAAAAPEHERRWTDILRRVYHQSVKDDVLGSAAKLAFYFLLALFPLLLMLTTLIGLAAQSGSELRAQLLSYLAAIAPPAAFRLIDEILEEVGRSATGGKVWLGLLGTLWAASAGVDAMTDALNRAYNAAESRSWWKARVLALALTVGLAFLIIAALVLAISGERLASVASRHLGFGRTFAFALKVAQWPAVVAFILLAFDLIYYFAPNLRRRRWQWLSPGALAAMALWLAASVGFRIYLRRFSDFTATYGSLGAVIVLMLWLYFTGAAILIGGEINSELRDPAAARSGSS
jgi:membrane protein